jgi:hypothetical protein
MVDFMQLLEGLRMIRKHANDMEHPPTARLRMVTGIANGLLAQSGLEDSAEQKPESAPPSERTQVVNEIRHLLGSVEAMGWTDLETEEVLKLLPRVLAELGK